MIEPEPDLNEEQAPHVPPSCADMAKESAERLKSLKLLPRITIDVAAKVELSAYETPSFHDRLVRAASGQHRPIQMVDGLIGTIGAVLGEYLTNQHTVLYDQHTSVPARDWADRVGRHGHVRTAKDHPQAHRHFARQCGGVPALHRTRRYVIFQDFAGYQLTARQNIGLGSVEHLDDEHPIHAAATHAGADRYLQALQNGYGTILSADYDGGRDLSVGQWQRVALARAFIRDAPLIILDEPSASLDPRAEHDLFSRIRSLYKGRTVLLISHRYNTVRDADHIYVLNSGRVVEHGSHSELIASAGVYAELFTLQAKAYTGEAARSSK